MQWGVNYDADYEYDAADDADDFDDSDDFGDSRNTFLTLDEKVSKGV